MAIVVIEETDLELIIEKAVAKAFARQSLSVVPDLIPEELIQAPQAAKLFNVSLSTIHSYKKQGVIPFHRIGRRVFFKKTELLDCLKKIN